MIDREGLVPNNKFQKILGRFNFTHKINDKINVTSNNYFNKSKRVGFEDVAQVMLDSLLLFRRMVECLQMIFLVMLTLV